MIKKTPINTGIRAVGDKTSKYPHNPIIIKEIEFIKLAFVAFIFFFYKNKDFEITYAIKKYNRAFILI